MLEAVVKSAQHMLAPYNKLLKTKVVGFDRSIREVELALGLVPTNEKETCKCVLVHGMGGVGKTTLARAVYDAAETKFSGRRVFCSLGQSCLTEADLSRKRRDLLKVLSHDDRKPSFVNIDDEREHLRNVLGCGPPKMLVLDDLWKLDQLHWLLACDDTESAQAGMALLHPGSCVLLTSRKQLLLGKEHGMHLLHLAELDEGYSSQLLCQEAFGAASPPLALTPSHMEQALRICGGLPLALQVLGRQLRPVGTEWQVRIS